MEENTLVQQLGKVLEPHSFDERIDALACQIWLELLASNDLECSDIFQELDRLTQKIREYLPKGLRSNEA